MRVLHFIGALVAAVTIGMFHPATASEGRGASARLSPPEGAPQPEARGEVVLNPALMIVKAEGLAPGTYDVVLDDGSGAKTSIGAIVIPPASTDDEGEEPSDGEDDGEDDEEEDGEDDDEDSEAVLKLSGETLPFGAASPLELGGRAICVNDGEGAVVLAGTTPQRIVERPERHNGQCPLSRPDPAVDEDAEGRLKLESGEGRVVIKVHLFRLAPGGLYEVAITNPAGDMTEVLGTITANGGGNGQFKVDSARGDPIPFGAGDLAALEGYGVSVSDEADAVVLIGTVCAAQSQGGPGEPGDKPAARCFEAVLDGAQEVPPVDTTASGTARIELGRRDGTALHYEVEVQGLSGPAIGLHIHSGAPGEPGPVIVALDHETLRGEVEIDADVIAALVSGNTYVNVHTDANPDGEIRGQLTVCPDDDEGEDEGDDEEEEEEEEEEEDGEEPENGEAGGAAGEAAPLDEPFFLMVGAFDAGFLRGDANRDQQVDISDAVSTLMYLFGGGARPYCLDAADANDDGRLDVSDAVGVASYLFLGTPPPAAPGVFIAGSDPTGDGLYCEETP